MSRNRSPLRLALAVVGFTAIIAQLTLMREMIAAFYGNELLFGAVLAAWMAWVAAGASGLGRLVLSRHGRSLPRIFAAGVALLGLLLPATLIAARGSRIFLGVTPGALVNFGPALAMVVVVTASFCLVSGALFTLGVRLAAEADAGAGQAYVWESAGAVIGGVLFSFALIRWLDPFQVVLLVALVDWVMAASLLLHRRAVDRETAQQVGAVSLHQRDPSPDARRDAPAGVNPLRLTGGSVVFKEEARGRRRYPLRSSAPPLLRTLAPLLLLLLVPLALLVGHALNQATLRWQWPTWSMSRIRPTAG